MQGILNTYFTISPSFLLNEYDALDSSQKEMVRFNIFLRDVNSITPALLKKINSIKNRCIFSLSSLLLCHNNFESIASQIFLLLSTNTIKGESKILLPIIIEHYCNRSDLKSAFIETYLFNQGITNLYSPFFNSNKNGGTQHEKHCIFHLYEANLIGDKNKLFDNETADDLSFKRLIIGFEKDIIKSVELDEIIKETNCKSGLGYQNFNQYFTEKNEADAEDILWKNRALLYQSFLVLSKAVQEKEYYEILDWYHTEYEILPLWYKRFGHIIKVIMGKRSFRSLFDDNVKKYKD